MKKIIVPFFLKQFSHVKTLFLDRSLASKFKFIYIFIIVLCMCSNIAIVRFFYIHEVKNAIKALASQTLETISQNVDSSIKVISKTSTYLLGSSDIQDYLGSGRSGHNSAMLSKNLRNTLYLALESMPAAASIMIIDETGDYECAARYTLPHPILDAPKEADWYEEVRRLQGTAVFLINGGGYFSGNEQENYLSLIRLVNSTEDAKPIGYMIINIPLSSLFSYAQEGDENYSDICVYSHDSIVLNFTSESLRKYYEDKSAEFLRVDKEEEITVNNENYLLLNTQNPSLDLHYFSATKYISRASEYKPFLLICLFTGLISTAMLLVISFCTKRFVTAPLYRLTNEMKKMEQGDFKPAYVTGHKDEIGQLQDTYNEMANKIQNLLDSKILEQKRMRKAELKILQEQIKPHFLYNTLSGIAYLITSKQNEAACDLIISLSEYYRESLSKGSEQIPLATEISIVKNYLKLQKMRFQDAFEDEYEIQKEAFEVMIPRLVLQPLVENSLYHGILPTGDFGTIKIKCCIKYEKLMLHIIDTGMGMSKNQIEEILNEETEWKKSFGLRGTVERLQIFYNEKDIFGIESSLGAGTEITFCLPLKEKEE